MVGQACELDINRIQGGVLMGELKEKDTAVGERVPTPLWGGGEIKQLKCRQTKFQVREILQTRRPIMDVVNSNGK